MKDRGRDFSLEIKRPEGDVPKAVDEDEQEGGEKLNLAQGVGLKWPRIAERRGKDSAAGKVGVGSIEKSLGKNWKQERGLRKEMGKV